MQPAQHAISCECAGFNCASTRTTHKHNLLGIYQKKKNKKKRTKQNRINLHPRRWEVGNFFHSKLRSLCNKNFCTDIILAMKTEPNIDSGVLLEPKVEPGLCLIEPKLEPGICLEESDHKQVLADAVHFAANLLKEEGLMSGTVSSVIGASSQEMGREIFRYLKGIPHKQETVFVKSERAEIDSDVEVEFESIAARENVEDEEDDKSEGDEDHWTSDEEMTKDFADVPWHIKVKAVTLATLYPRWSLRAISKKTTHLLRRPEQLMMWKQAVKKSTVRENYGIIDEMTYKRFVDAYSKGEPISCRTLQKWALESSSQFLSSSFIFKASESWIFKFQRKHNIRKCRVTGLLKM